MRVNPKTWQAFELTAIEQLPSNEVAERLEMRLEAVYKAKSNVLKLLREEVEGLEQAEFA